MKRLIAVSPTPDALVAAALCRDEWDVLVGVKTDSLSQNLLGCTFNSEFSEIIIILEGIADIGLIDASIAKMCESGKSVLLIASTRKTDEVKEITYEHHNFRYAIESDLLDALATAFPLISTRTPLSEELLSFDQELLTYIRYHLAHFFMSGGDSSALLRAINGFFDMNVNKDKSLIFPDGCKRSINIFRNLDFPYIECKSHQIQVLKRNIVKVSKTNLNTLILGESGTCKQSVAFFIHDLGENRKAEFIRFSCLGEDSYSTRLKLFGCKKGAIPGLEEDYEGLVAQAEGGTLFISNIQCMSIETQAIILKFLKSKTYCPYGQFEERKSNIRVIASALPSFNLKNSNVLPELYYRVAEAELFTPPLRDVKKDMWTIVRYIIFAIYRKGNSINVKDTLRYFKYRLKYLNEHAWIGNIRELVVMVKRYAILEEDVIKNLQTKH